MLKTTPFMNLSFFFFTSCSIPEDQKPIIEYLTFKENFFLCWTTFSINQYNKFLVLFYSPFFFYFKNTQSFLFFICSFFLLFPWLQLFQRLQSSRLFYEETSWFDSQIWEKYFYLIRKDRLINSQKLLPIIRRFSRSYLTLFCFHYIIFYFF